MKLSRLATLISIYGIILPAIGWALAGLIWGYVAVAFVIQDRLKLLAYSILDPEAALPRMRGHRVARAT